MTAARPGVGHGRGGQGGHEPRAQVQAREQRVLERSVAGLSQREIAAEEGITQSAVSKILQRVEARVFKEFVARVEQQKGRQDMSLRFIFQEGMKAWEASKTDATRRVQKKTQPAAGASSTTVAQLVVENRHGDSRYLEIARKALADQRRVWGLDAPHKVDVRASQRPFEAMTDEALAAELRRQRQLLADIDVTDDVRNVTPEDGEDA